MSDYYKIPFEAGAIVERRTHSVCSLEDSIRQFIRLVLLTGFNEYKRDPYLGCRIWDIEFDLLPGETQSKQIIQESLERSLKKYETRLANIKAEASIEESSPLLKKIRVHISGTIKATATSFAHEETIFLCPKSTL